MSVGYLYGLVTRFDNLLPEYLSINKFISRFHLLKREVVEGFGFLFCLRNRVDCHLAFVDDGFFPYLFVGFLFVCFFTAVLVI